MFDMGFGKPVLLPTFVLIQRARDLVRYDCTLSLGPPSTFSVFVQSLKDAWPIKAMIPTTSREYSNTANWRLKLV